MSTETKIALDNISISLNTEKKTIKNDLANLKERVDVGLSNIAGLPAQYSSEIAEINGYSLTGTIHEQGQKSDLSTYYNEFTVITDLLTAIKTKLAEITEL